MNKFKKITALLLLAVIFILGVTACSKNEEVTLGEVKNGKYTNEYFGMELDVPDGWTVYTQDELNELMKTGTEVVNEVTDNNIDLDKLNYLCLFGAYNPVTEGAFIVTAEKPAGLTSIVTSIDKYLDISKEHLEAVEMGYEISSYSKRTIGKKEFTYFIGTLPQYLEDYQLHLYAVKDGGYFVSVNYYSTDKEDLAALETVISNMKYK